MSITPATWTILALLRWTTEYFAEKKVSEPRASAEILLARVLGVSRLDLYLRHDQPLAADELARFKALMVRRRLGEPVAYLTGHREFWSLDFWVTPATLIPRPETEVLVEAVVMEVGEGAKGHRPLPPPPHPLPQSPKGLITSDKVESAPPYQTAIIGLGRGEWGEGQGSQIPGPSPHQTLAIDVGVGSGALVVALAKELPDLLWVAVDVSVEALGVARQNARRHGVSERIAFFQGDLLSGIKTAPRFGLIAANLPYVSRGEWEQLPAEIRDYEPPEALLGGEDGLALLRPLCREAHLYLQPDGWLALEVGAGQAERVMAILDKTKAYDSLKSIKDYHGIARVVLARRAAGA
jgi:release factor glutamine methyltransferase